MLVGRMGINIDIKSYCTCRKCKYLFQACGCFFNTVIKGPPDFRVGKVGRRWENLLCPVKQKSSEVNMVLQDSAGNFVVPHPPPKKKKKKKKEYVFQ